MTEEQFEVMKELAGKYGQLQNDLVDLTKAAEYMDSPEVQVSIGIRKHPAGLCIPLAGPSWAPIARRGITEEILRVRKEMADLRLPGSPRQSMLKE